jgi:hypothetical protein
MACRRAVTVLRSNADLNPHEPDLRKPADGDAVPISPHKIPAGQAMIAMCPRTDTHLTYMINIAMKTEFSLAAGGAR